MTNYLSPSAGLKDNVNSFLQELEETIIKQESLQSALERDEALEARLAQELKNNVELKEKHKQVMKLQAAVDKLADRLKDNIKLKDSDENRLKKAKKMYILGKHITGVKFDFKQQPHIWKGYVKNKATKVLDAFEIDTKKMSSEEAKEKIWMYIENAALTDWGLLCADNSKENKVPNKLY